MSWEALAEVSLVGLKTLGPSVWSYISSYSNWISHRSCEGASSALLFAHFLHRPALVVFISLLLRFLQFLMDTYARPTGYALIRRASVIRPLPLIAASFSPCQRCKSRYSFASHALSETVNTGVDAVAAELILRSASHGVATSADGHSVSALFHSLNQALGEGLVEGTVRAIGLPAKADG